MKYVYNIDMFKEDFDKALNTKAVEIINNYDFTKENINQKFYEDIIKQDIEDMFMWTQDLDFWNEYFEIDTTIEGYELESFLKLEEELNNKIREILGVD